MNEQTEGLATISVSGDGRAFRRVAMRLDNRGQFTTLVGELDGVRAYVRERDGKVQVILSKEDLYE